MAAVRAWVADVLSKLYRPITLIGLKEILPVPLPTGRGIPHESNQREAGPETGAFVCRRCHGDRPVMPFDDLGGDVQT